ncbi:MAG: H-NS histone family protein [Succinivibrionaceae bacterium]|nr:H-NS histone family protein [Succinivibrionaceae bacterium]
MKTFVKNLLTLRILKSNLKGVSLDDLRDIMKNLEEVMADAERYEEENRQEIERRNQELQELQDRLNDLNLSADEKRKFFSVGAPRRPRGTVEPKFRFPKENGEEGTWTGRGRAPRELKALLDQGHSLDEYRIQQEGGQQ